MYNGYKKILIVCRAFYPENSPRSFRATELAMEFARQGHDVSVLTLDRGNAYVDFLKKYKGIKILPLDHLKLKNINVNGGVHLKVIRRGINRILFQLFEYPSIELSFRIAQKLRQMEGFDILISIAMPHTVHWGVAKSWGKRGKIAKVWIADCGDPYMGEVTDSFRKPFYFKYVEKWFCNKADYITIPIESARKAYYKEFHNKIHVIPQGFSFKEIPQGFSKHVNPIPTFAYAGNFIPGVRDPKLFIEYLLKQDKSFRFEIYTKQRHLIDQYEKKSSGRIVIRDFVPREQLFQEFRRMDFLVNFDNNTTIHSPSKLIDYSLSGLPVLNITKNPDINNIEEFLNGDYSSRLILPNPEQYRIENVAGKFLKFLSL